MAGNWGRVLSVLVAAAYWALAGCSAGGAAQVPSGAISAAASDQAAVVDQPKQADLQTSPAPAPVSRARPNDAFGAGDGIRPEYEACMRQQPEEVSTAGHREDCADAEFAYQDRRLNAAYEAEIGQLRSEGTARVEALRVQQREWLRQTQQACGKAAEQAGSTMGPAAESTCLMETTARRATELAATRRR